MTECSSNNIHLVGWCNLSCPDVHINVALQQRRQGPGAWVAAGKMFQIDPDRPTDPQTTVHRTSPLQNRPCVIDPLEQLSAVEREQEIVRIYLSLHISTLEPLSCFIQTRKTASKTSDADSNTNDAVARELLKRPPIAFVCQVHIHLRRCGQRLLAGNVSNLSTLSSIDSFTAEPRTSCVSEMKKYRLVQGYPSVVVPTRASMMHFLVASM